MECPLAGQSAFLLQQIIIVVVIVGVQENAFILHLDSHRRYRKDVPCAAKSVLAVILLQIRDAGGADEDRMAAFSVKRGDNGCFCMSFHQRRETAGTEKRNIGRNKKEAAHLGFQGGQTHKEGVVHVGGGVMLVMDKDHAGIFQMLAQGGCFVAGDDHNGGNACSLKRGYDSDNHRMTADVQHRLEITHFGRLAGSADHGAGGKGKNAFRTILVYALI